MLFDQFNRVHDYLRISITDNCDLRCFYCVTSSNKIMQPDEIASIAAVFVNEGVKKIRLTGGEPLIRKDFTDIINRLSKLGTNLSITTNGTRLHEFVDTIKSANVESINISLDTLNRERFILMTKRDKQEQVIRNIRLMILNGFNVKVNVVVIRGINDNEILDFVEWTRDTNIHIRFIEFMPFDRNQWEIDKVITLKEILNIIQSKYQIESIERKKHDTSKQYFVKGFKGMFAIISTMSSHFCGDCNRIRLTADGKMKNCLFSNSEIDILTAFREKKDIVSIIKNNIYMKEEALGGQFSSEINKIESNLIQNRSMIRIGG